ncbi:hypothetical protein DPEC_G00204170 [Dallia pectoralis]|uniref:Uncharacterized protein n=1 Tax=Dallia pectoralis TaxID=75939 RepID=A0ACC2GA04_DALPE|nr:hypothetical protein DPEC_G00204170 [Dallia pectoralis]
MKVLVNVCQERKKKNVHRPLGRHGLGSELDVSLAFWFLTFLLHCRIGRDALLRTPGMRGDSGDGFCVTEVKPGTPAGWPYQGLPFGFVKCETHTTHLCVSC